MSTKALELRRMRASATRACNLLRNLAHEDRLMLLCEISGGEKSVGDLETLVGLHQPSLSQQLGVLRREGLVKTRREGKRIYYRLGSEDALKVIESLHAVFCAPSAKKRAGSG
jgi:DNA-binding transcriptional ArsR family regulator